MAPIGKLYSYMPNARCLKILAAAKLNSIEIEIASNYQHSITNKTPDFLAKFPTGKVPAFESAEGTVTLVESDAIAQYVAESGPQATNLLGVDTATRAKIRQWITFTECEVYGNMLGVVLPRAGYVPYDSEKETSSASGLAWALGVVEKHLSHGNRDWLATSDRLSLADLTLASALYWAFMHYLDEERRKKFPVTTAWYLHTIGIEGVQEVFGPPNLVSVAKEFA